MKMRMVFVLFAVLLTAACTRPDAAVQQETPRQDPPPQSTKPSAQRTDPHDQALQLIASADFQGAEALLREAVTGDAMDAEAWNDLSLVQSNLAKWPEAVRSARKALELKPDMSYAHYNLGWALLHTGEWDSAITPLKAAAQAQPDRPEPLAALGRWYHMGAELYEAKSLYAKAVALGYEPANQLLADLQAEMAKPWNAVTAGTPNGKQVPADMVATHKADKVQVARVNLGNGPHLLITGEDGRMTEGWVLVPQGEQVINALYARMDFGITPLDDAVKLSYRKYKQNGGYIIQASLWRHDSKSNRYEIVSPDQSGTWMITSSGLCNSLPVYLPLTQGHQSPDGFLSYGGLQGRYGLVKVTGGPYATWRGIRVGDSEQRVIEAYGPLNDGLYRKEPAYLRFEFSNGLVKSFTVACDSTTSGPLGK